MTTPRRPPSGIRSASGPRDAASEDPTSADSEHAGPDDWAQVRSEGEHPTEVFAAVGRQQRSHEDYGSAAADDFYAYFSEQPYGQVPDHVAQCDTQVFERVPAESVGAEPALAEPAVGEPAVAEPAHTEAAAAGPAHTEPAVAEPFHTEPASVAEQLFGGHFDGGDDPPVTAVPPRISAEPEVAPPPDSRDGDAATEVFARYRPEPEVDDQPAARLDSDVEPVAGLDPAVEWPVLSEPAASGGPSATAVDGIVAPPDTEPALLSGGHGVRPEEYPGRSAALAGAGLGAAALAGSGLGAVAADTSSVDGEARRLQRPIALVSVLLLVAVLGAGGALFAWTKQRAAAAPPVAANLAFVDPVATKQMTDQVSKAIEAIYSYDSAQLDQSEKRALSVITGRYADEFTQNFTTVRVLAPKEKASLTSTVVGIGAKTLTADHATLLVLVNQVGHRGDTPNPLRAGIQLSVSAEKVDGQWKVSAVTQK